MKSTPTTELNYLGRCLEGFLYGLYTGLFATYLHFHTSKFYADRSHRTTNILLYAVCVLYVLSVGVIVLDIVRFVTAMTKSTLYTGMDIGSFVISGCCDFISQSILIYRCWIVWGYNIHVVIIPSIVAFAFLGTWLASAPEHISSGQVSNIFGWEAATTAISLAISMTVNAVVMGLIVLRIFKVFLKVKSTFKLGAASSGRKLRSIIFILIESGMALFSIQLARLVASILYTWRGYESAAYNAFMLIIPIHQVLNGITPTIILVRVSMGLSFHDEHSLEEATLSLCYAPNYPVNVIPEMETINTGHQGSRGDDIGEAQLSNEIQMVDR